VIDIIYVVVGSGILILLFVVLWLRERRKSRNENIAYGLRTSEDQTENTKTNITGLETGFREAMSKLEDLGEVAKDQRGQWRWVKSGLPVGELLRKNSQSDSS
jgi:Flp pilus assembly protein TadB